MQALTVALVVVLACDQCVAAPERALLAVKSHNVTLQVSAVSDDILRVSVVRGGEAPQDASWAVTPELFSRYATATVERFALTTQKLRAIVDPETLRLRVQDTAGHRITEDALVPMSFAHGGFSLHKLIPVTEHYFGLGDKAGGLDRRGGSFINWNTDAWAYSSSSDPLYKSIPFFIGVGGEGGSYGIFLDNSWRSWFDFGHTDPDKLTFGAAHGPIIYYIIAGPRTAEVVRRYGELTGKAPLMPRWVLGYQQSRWGYMSAAEIEGIANHLRADHIPADVIWMDIDYQDRNRPFTINRKTFPDLKELVYRMGERGIKLISIVDLHVANAPGQGYAPYESGISGGHFVHNADGTHYIAPVWPGPAVFPDFTRAATRDWWGAQFKGFLDDGVAGFWNDMNEPAIFDTPTKTMPLDTVHRIEGDGFASRAASHAEIHNVYGMENTRATYDGARKLRPDERAFVMTRASFAGGQKFAATWTGDNSSTWDHLKLSVSQVLNLGLSGFVYSGADVGGFTGGPSPDLMTKWFEYAAFAPVFRDHSAKDAPRAEPWVDGPTHLAIRRHFVEERYRLMPYLYSVAAASASTGDPIMRPVFYDYPDSLSAPCNTAMTFTVGEILLVAGNPKPESPQPYSVCLPQGGWYDFASGDRVADAAASGAKYTMFDLSPKLEALPVYIRAGTILPKQPLVQSTSETPAGPLELHIYPGANCYGELYDDDGHTMKFMGDGYVRQSLKCASTTDGSLTLSFEPRQGSYTPWWKSIAVIVHGGHKRYVAKIGGRPTAQQHIEIGGDFAVIIPDQPHPVTITLDPA